jgi:molybdopterin synthase catalytic subunit
MLDVQIVDSPLNAEKCIATAASDAAGAINVFIGTVRNQTSGKRVVKLIYEAYEPMAVSEMKKIAEQAKEKFQAIEVSIHHRVGELSIGEAAVVIAVSSSHRKAAFDGCKFIIDTIKQTVPIWKKEIFEDGEIWVAAHP